ncbi:RING finger and SPRY domain-containing protein 1 [Toxocara canis]|nr:RING finger and SPRY domain-containing protein 1 [Toxocara canis]
MKRRSSGSSSLSIRGSPPRPPSEGMRRRSSDERESFHSQVSSPFFYGNDRLTVNVASDVKELIKQVLQLIRSLVSNEQEPPTPLLKLNLIADKEGGWVLVVICLIEAVPVEDALGPAVITLFLDEGPLPTKETVTRLIARLRLDEPELKMSPVWHRNTCIVLGCLAEKLAGASSVHICTNTTLTYLLDNLKPEHDTEVIMYALIALEKFAQTSENRLTICRRLEKYAENPLIVLESWRDDAEVKRDFLKQQVAFCAQWSLDNIFVCEKREFSYMKCDVSNIGAMLNHEDVSEYLKIGSDGLEARCDVSSFESVRCTFEAVEGVWFYEALILTPGVMQIGFATKRSRFCNHEGFGIGDDECSIAYDGCRQLIWHNAQCQKHEHDPWKAGDYLGCLLDIAGGYVQFFLNGRALQVPHREFMGRHANNKETGFFAAASFMSFQQCRFNFGSEPFRYPPSSPDFQTFNDYGHLTKEQKTILPRRRKMELLSQLSIPDDSCHICYSSPVDTLLEPCGHSGLCFACSEQLELCPLCRVQIAQRTRIVKHLSVVERKQSSGGKRLGTLV